MLLLQDAAKVTDDQVQDLIYLWRMCSTRRGQLANARKVQLTQVPAECFSDVQMPDPRDNVANLTAMANFINENGKEDFKVYSDTMCALYRGVGPALLLQHGLWCAMTCNPLKCFLFNPKFQ